MRRRSRIESKSYKSFKIRRTFGFLLILIGIGIIGSIYYHKYEANRKNNELMAEIERQFEDLSNPSINENTNISQKESNLSSEQSPDAKSNSLASNGCAIMEIPKIDLKVGVAEGVDTETLNSALGHFNKTANPGQVGNFCVAGHRSYTYNQYFNRLNELEIGDDIFVTTKNGEFKYVVTDKKIVEPTETNVLDQQTNDRKITLVTCHPERSSAQRLIVIGKITN